MSLKGLLIVGSAPGCGKTVVATGLAAMLQELGTPALALKPLDFAPPCSVRPASDQQFMDAVLRPPHQEEVVTVASAYEVTPVHWNRLLDTCRKLIWPTFIECPGSVASPWKFVDNQMMDAADVAHLLNLPVLLVCRKTPDAIAEAVPAIQYLKERGATPIGWVAVETLPVEAPHWDDDLCFLHGEYPDIPFLGEVTYSPSISVPALQQGNLIRSLEFGIDLLPIQQGMEAYR